jgi:hypothetical protein
VLRDQEWAAAEADGTGLGAFMADPHHRVDPIGTLIGPNGHPLEELAGYAKSLATDPATVGYAIFRLVGPGTYRWQISDGTGVVLGERQIVVLP